MRATLAALALAAALPAQAVYTRSCWQGMVTELPAPMPQLKLRPQWTPGQGNSSPRIGTTLVLEMTGSTPTVPVFLARGFGHIPRFGLDLHRVIPGVGYGHICFWPSMAELLPIGQRIVKRYPIPNDPSLVYFIWSDMLVAVRSTPTIVLVSDGWSGTVGSW